MNSSESQLVEETIKGDSQSFDILVGRFTKPIYNFTYRLTGNTQVAEDLTQETWIRVWKNLKKYKPEQSFKAWIFTIARNLTTDYHRKKKMIPFSNLGFDEDTPYETTIADQEILPDELLAQVQDTHELEQLLEQLPAEYQSVLTLHYQEDMTFDEIGKVLDKPLNTVKSWHRRALIKLRELINEN